MVPHAEIRPDDRIAGMNKNYALVIAGAVLVIAAGIIAYLYLRPSDNFSYTPPAVQPPGHGVIGNARLDLDPHDIVITYTDSGFSPADITITQGERVRFLNQSSGLVWPASGVHPTHSLYPEKESSDCLGSAFDACTPISKGEYYDFTFYYLGRWSYHDHIQAFNTGSITVVAATSTK